MSIICALFGHKPLTTSGWSGGVGYAKAAYSALDGIGTYHLYLEAECPRCGQKYRICNTHVPKPITGAIAKDQEVAIAKANGE